MGKQRTKQHYEGLLNSNPNTTIGFTLAAQAVYASRNGVFDANADDYDHEAYRTIARDLKTKYGENLTVEQVWVEMGADQLSPPIIIRKIPTDLRRAFKVRCAREGISQQDKIIELMRGWAGRAEDRKRRKIV